MGGAGRGETRTPRKPPLLSPLNSHRVQLLVHGRHVVQVGHQLADEGAVGEDEDLGGLVKKGRGRGRAIEWARGQSVRLSRCARTQCTPASLTHDSVAGGGHGGRCGARVRRLDGLCRAKKGREKVFALSSRPISCLCRRRGGAAARNTPPFVAPPRSRPDRACPRGTRTPRTEHATHPIPDPRRARRASRRA